MIKIKKIIFIFFITLIFLEASNAKISDSIYMTVGNKPVLQSDIVNEIKIILILNNQSYSKEKSDQYQEAAIKSIVQRKIKKIELDRNNYFNFNKEDMISELTRLANNINLDLETLKDVFESNDLDFSIVEDQVKLELFWNSLIFQLYKNRISINPEEIEEKLISMQSENRKKEEYLISEILVRVSNEENLEEEIKELKNKIITEGFENVAKNISISESSINGGDLGWLNEDVISEKIKSTIVGTPTGQLSKAILFSEGILIFKIRDKRKAENNISLDEMKDQLINSEKLKILQMYSLSHYDKLRRSTSIKFFNE